MLVNYIIPNTKWHDIIDDMKKDKYTWDLTPLYNSDDDLQMEKDFTISIKKNYAFINKWKNRSDYLKNPKILREALDEYNGIAEKYGIGMRTEYYLILRNSQDHTNKKIIQKMKYFEKDIIKTENDIQFFELNISKIPLTKQKKFLHSKDLEPYKHYIERLFQVSKYMLSEKEEKILNLTSFTSYHNWIEMLEQFLSKETVTIIADDGKKKEIPFSENKKFLESKNKKVRDTASKEEFRILEKWSDVAEHEINSILQSQRVVDELKGFTRPDESRHMADDISTKTVDTMIETVVNNFSLPKKYYKLKARLFGKKKLSYFERYVPYGEITKKYSFEEAIQINKDIFKSLDNEFYAYLKSMYEKQQYDVYPYKGKRGGAFCIGELKTIPPYILLNHKDDLDSVLTISHETGHAINYYMMFQKQLALNCDNPLSIAEVASTFFEDFVLERLIADVRDEETRLAILMKKLESDIATVHRQVACYKFEQEMHKEFRQTSYLPKEKISSLFKKNMEAYMGDYVSQDRGSEYGWVSWSHIRTFFYVYSYANGLLISKALQNMVKEDPKNIEKVKVMLSTGSSKSPEQMFKDIGIDITRKEFWEKGLKEIEDIYSKAYELAKKLEKI